MDLVDIGKSTASGEYLEAPNKIVSAANGVDYAYR